MKSKPTAGEIVYLLIGAMAFIAAIKNGNIAAAICFCALVYDLHKG